MMRSIRHILGVLNFLKGLLSVLLRKDKVTPQFVKDLKLRVPFLTFLYSATWMSKYFNGEDSDARVMDAAMVIFGVREKGNEAKGNSRQPIFIRLEAIADEIESEINWMGPKHPSFGKKGCLKRIRELINDMERKLI